MQKLALAALVVAGYSTMADAAVVTYTYNYGFDQITTSFQGSGVDSEGGRLDYAISRTATLEPEPASFEVSIDTDIHSLPGLQLEWFTASGNGVTTTLPGVGSRIINFDQSGMPEFWDLYVTSAVESTYYYSGGDLSIIGDYVGLDVLSAAPFNLGLPAGVDGYGFLSTTRSGFGTWSVDGGTTAAAPLPTPLPATALLLLGGIGMLALRRRRG